MQPLTFDNFSYRAGAQRLFLISGEIHYFRVAPDAWRDRLVKLKDAGANAVATYVPWLIHEPEEGRFDFSPRYDVEQFLQLCAEVGLWAIVRPGPYQYSELVYAGLPGWLFEKYPEFRARHPDGAPFDKSPSISYVHPQFLEKVRSWFDQVIPRLARFQTDRGGPVAAMQIDNELTGIHDWCGGWDYHPDAMGVGREHGRWPDFLRRKYITLAGVNAAYETAAVNWADVRPIRPVPDLAPAQRRCARDYQECYFASIADYCETLAGMMRGHGITVPLVHNSAGPDLNARFVETVRRMGKNFVFGADHYYNLDQTWPQNNPTPQYAGRCFYSLESLRNLGMPPTVYELPGGSLADWPPVTPQDAAACYALNIALGMKGYNYYIFAGGENPPGCGTTGQVYDYGAALSPTGEKRPLYFVQQKLAAFLHRHEWLAGAHQACNFNVALVWDHARSQYLSGGGLMGSWAAFEFMRRGLLTGGFCANLAPSLLDISDERLFEHLDKPLALACSSSLPAEIQRRLVRFLKAGGKLLLCPIVPTLDENFRPCRVLADFIGTGEQTLAPNVAVQLTAFGARSILVNGQMFRTPPADDSAAITARDERSGAVIGFSRTFGEGKVNVLGLQWIHAMREHAVMLRGALTDLGLQPLIENPAPTIWPIIRTDGQRTMLFLLNLFTSAATTHVRFRAAAADPAWIDTGPLEIPAMSVAAWHEGSVTSL